MTHRDALREQVRYAVEHYQCIHPANRDLAGIGCDECATAAVWAVVEPALAQREECGLCGGPMSRNPHPDAGKPGALLEVGAVWVCVPCTVRSRHGWSERYNEASAALAQRDAEQRAERDAVHADLVAILAALGIGDHARPYSSHDVVQREILPAIAAARPTHAERLLHRQALDHISKVEAERDEARRVISAVGALHTREWAGHGPDKGEDGGAYCAHCSSWRQDYVPWPCPTVAALAGDQP